jgi:hypothetical protein
MEWLNGLLTAGLTAVLLAFIGYLFTLQQRKTEKRGDQIEAVASLRFELQSNLAWMDDPFGKHNYLRDEGWVALKSKGYISYLPSPIPVRVVAAYSKTHRLNEHIRVLKEEYEKFDAEETERDRAALRTELLELIRVLDTKYPKIGKNFRDDIIIKR